MLPAAAATGRDKAAAHIITQVHTQRGGVGLSRSRHTAQAQRAAVAGTALGVDKLERQGTRRLRATDTKLVHACKRPPNLDTLSSSPSRSCVLTVKAPVHWWVPSTAVLECFLQRRSPVAADATQPLAVAPDQTPEQGAVCAHRQTEGSHSRPHADKRVPSSSWRVHHIGRVVMDQQREAR